MRCGQIIGLASWEMERDREQKVGDGMWPFHNGISIVWPMEANQQKPEKCWYWVSENIIWNVLHPVRNLDYCYRALFVSLKQNHSPGRLYRPLRSVQRYFWDLVRFGTAIFTEFVRVKVVLVFAMKKFSAFISCAETLLSYFPQLLDTTQGSHLSIRMCFYEWVRGRYLICLYIKVCLYTVW